MPQNVVVVGASGRIARTRHLPALMELRDRGQVERIGVTSRNDQTLEALRAEFPELIVLSQDLAFSDPSFGVLLDASGPTSRTEVVRRALAQGKHVLAEKPLGLTAQEAESLCTMAQQAGVSASMVQDKLFTPGFKALAHLLEKNHLGQIASISGEFGYWVDSGLNESHPMQRPAWNYQSARGGDIVADLFTHWTYMIGLVSPIAAVSSVAPMYFTERRDERGAIFSSDVSDSLTVTGFTAGGTSFSVHNSWTTRPFVPFTLTVNGENATARATPLGCEVYKESGATNETPETVQHDFENDEFVVMWQHFFDTISRGEPDISGFSSGLHAARVAESVHKSLEMNSQRVAVGGE